MDDAEEAVTTGTTAARHVGGRAIESPPWLNIAPGPGEVRIDVAARPVDIGSDVYARLPAATLIRNAHSWWRIKVTKLDEENPNGGRPCPS
jgi:hypothetical protein